VARSRSTSARAWSSAACSGVRPARPGTDDANASNAPCFAVFTMCSTVELSTPYRSAASRWVACPVNTATNSSYFSLVASRRRRRVFAESMPRSDMMISLQNGQTHRPVAGYY